MTSRPLLASLLIFVGATAMQAQEVESLHQRLFSIAPPSWAPDPDEPELRRRLRETGTDPVHGAVQFAARLSQGQRAALADVGVELLGSLGRNAYAVSLPRSLDVLNSLPRRTRATWIRPGDKFGPGIATGKHPEWAFDAQKQRIRVLIEFYPSVRPGLLKRKLASMRVPATRHGPRTLAATVKPADLKKIAKLVGVRHIQHGPIPFLPLNSAARSLVRTNLAQQPSFGGPRPTYRVSGEGVKIGICDWGIDESHDDFWEVTQAGEKGASRIQPQRIGMVSAHGTHVASIAAGSGLVSWKDEYPAFSLRGQAPLARIADFHFFRSNLEQTYDALEKHHTDLTNHSYAQSMLGYGAVAADLDEIVRGDASWNGDPIAARPQIWSAGNHGQEAELKKLGAKETGYHSVFTSAKNTISVGSIDSMTGRLSRYSSLGPTFDGRIKPDLVAPGCHNSDPSQHEMMKVADSEATYAGDCGTSMAAPVVTGIAALMMHQYRLSYGEPPNLLPSTYKAMLVHTAEDQIKVTAYTAAEGEFSNPDTLDPVLYHAGPDFATGWGMVDAERAREIVTHADQWKQGKITTPGEEHEWCLEVPEGSAEVRATIAWDDAPGRTDLAYGDVPRRGRRPSDYPLLVNDLDLELVQPPPDSSVVLPWTIDPPRRNLSSQSEIEPAHRGEDHRNNVEMATFDHPEHGTWRVKVRGTVLDDGMKQRYSLVTSHPISTCP